MHALRSVFFAAPYGRTVVAAVSVACVANPSFGGVMGFDVDPFGSVCEFPMPFVSVPATVSVAVPVIEPVLGFLSLKLQPARTESINTAVNTTANHFFMKIFLSGYDFVFFTL